MGVNMLSNMRLCSNVPAQSIVQTALGGHQSVNDYIRPGGRVYEQRNFVYEALNTLAASVLAPLLSDAVIAEMTCVGSLMIIGLALNMLGLTKIKVTNFIPAVFLPILLCRFM